MRGCVRKLYQNVFIRFALLLLLITTVVYILVPKPDLYNKYSFSSAVYDTNGKLLKLSLSNDDKYRLFVSLQNVPIEARQALLLYEDQYFYYHIGVNPFSLFRAILAMSSGGRRQGASTITMQVARIVFQINSTSFLGKIEQIFRALQIELFYSKNEILEAYFNLAPYGGNIEGIGAAALIYFQQNADKLNLPQILALTVIPQNPSKRSLLTEINRKQNSVAYQRIKNIWLEKYQHSQNEYLNLPLSSSVYLPDDAPHFTRRMFAAYQGEIKTALNLNYQKDLEDIIRRYVAEQRQKGVFNASALLLDSQDMSVLAYVGSADFYNKNISGQVDGIVARRSPGSTLKPFVYALALEQGLIHPLSMLKDVPSRYGFYSPENFDHTYYGLLNATRALTLSRNIPAVELLMQVGEKNFYELLKKCGVNLPKKADYYGLAMALGGVEVSMENLASMYAMLANNGKFSNIVFLKSESADFQQLLLPEAAFLTRYMLFQNESIDKNLSKSIKRKAISAAWKTGTSFSYKDAWTAGIFGKYVLVVWLGNFNGKSNSAFVGRKLAAPLFFRIARRFMDKNLLSSYKEETEYLNLAKVKVCQDTGDLATEFCHKTVETYFIPGVTSIKNSNITRLIPIDKKSGLRACRHTPPQTELKSYNFWPSEILSAYQKAGINLQKPPAFKENCQNVEDFVQGTPPKILRPYNGEKILLSSLQGGKILAEATVDADTNEVYWFINNRLCGVSKANEIYEITPPQYGRLEVKAVDGLGRQTAVSVQIQSLN